MNIRRIATWTEHFELSRPYTIAFRTVDSVRNGIVRIETDDGSVGLGCASPERFVTGETWEACDAALAEAGLRWLVGRGVHELAVLGRAHTALPTSITIGIKDAGATVQEAGEYLERGFGVLKVKLGHSLDDDIERLHRLRAPSQDHSPAVSPSRSSTTLETR